ncbi:MAG TPA: hypothetical protein PL033_02760 [Candidatus Brocadiia bacterium]|nr:hypothetical protein [Candidatus Brocadiia bacterium]
MAFKQLFQKAVALFTGKSSGPAEATPVEAQPAPQPQAQPAPQPRPAAPKPQPVQPAAPAQQPRPAAAPAQPAPRPAQPAQRPAARPTPAPRPAPAPAPVAAGGGGFGLDEEEDDLLKNLDNKLQESDKATKEAGALGLEAGAREEIQRLFEQMLPEYVPPIREGLVKLKAGNVSKVVVEGLLGAISPLIFAAEHVEADETFQILRRMRAPLDRARKGGAISKNDIKMLIREYNKMVIQLKESRKRAQGTVVAKRAADVEAKAELDAAADEPALIDVLSKIEGVGGEEIERLFAAGLTTVSTLRQATVKDVMDLTGINAALALQIVRAVYEAKPDK